MDYLAFLQKEIHAAAFATLAEDGRPEVRIIDIMLYDGHSLYFLTAKGQAFYRQLIEQKFVAITGEKGRRAVSLRGHVRVADPALLLSLIHISVRVLVLPDGQDPDEFLRSQGASAFRALKQSALTLTECKIQALATACDMQTENGRTAFAQKAAALLKPLSPVERERYERYIAKVSGFAVETIQQQTQSARVPMDAAPPKHRETPAEKEQGGALQERCV